MITHDIDAINEFVEKWKLDEISTQALFDTDEEVRTRMMEDFIPRDGTRNVNDLFQSFVKSRMNPTGSRQREVSSGFGGLKQPNYVKQQAQSRGRVRATEPGELCQEAVEFIDRHGLDEENQELLSQAPFDVQQRIAIEFAPKDASKDINLLFNSFCASRLEALPQFVNQTTKDFFAKFDISEESQLKFLKLDTDMRERVMREFDPREGTADVNGLFQSFVKSRIDIPIRGRRPMETRRETHRFETTRRRSRTPPRPRAARPPPPMRTKIEPVSQEDVDAFIVKWNLNEVSQEVLLQIPEEGLGRAMKEFGPKDESADIDNLFQSFAKSRVQGALQDMERGTKRPPPPPPRASRPLLSTPLTSMSARSFKNKYRFNEECRLLIDSLDEHLLVQAKVISEFQPKDKSRDVNKTFASFWNSRVSAALAETYRLSDESMKLYEDLSLEKKASVIAEFCPRDGVKNMDGLFATFCKSRAGGPGGIRRRERDTEEPRDRKRPRSFERRAPGTNSVSEFTQRLGLNAECKDMLLQFDNDTQQTIMGKFRPGKDVKDVQNLFRSFAKSFLVPR